MKIKIVQQGWEGFTGSFGAIDFKDGVSVSDVSDVEAQRVSAIVRIETLDGKDPSLAQQIIDGKAGVPIEALSLHLPTLEEQPEKKPEAKAYTAEELAEIADKGGIKAIRAIADPLHLKGQSIAELIGKILAASQGAPVAGAETETPAA